jgi:uncharacterized protein with HEPN domain
MTVATKKLLLDARDAGESIIKHTAAKALLNTSLIVFLQRAVEREFEIIGEALNRLDRLDPLTSACISELRRIVGFRNRIIHGYDTVDDAVVWGIVEKHLPSLMREVAASLEANNPTAQLREPYETADRVSADLLKVATRMRFGKVGMLARQSFAGYTRAHGDNYRSRETCARFA